MLHRLIFIVLFVPAFAFAQSKEGSSYSTGIGLRAGYHPGITLKHFISSGNAIEGIMQFRYRGMSITGLYEMHKMAFDEPQFRWFYGLGGHIGFYGRPGYVGFKNGYRYDDQRVSIGIDGILGLEYAIQEIPFTVGLDVKPYLDIYYPGFGWVDGALTVRYVF